MILGMSTHMFTLLHVTISLFEIASGIIVLYGMLTGRLYRRWNLLFLLAASLTSITGFFFANAHITPGIIFGVLTLFALSLAGVALYAGRLNGAFRGTFVVSTTVALYLDMFVLVAQLFRHVPLLKRLDGTGAGPAFASAQLLVLATFLWLGRASLKRFKIESSTGSQSPGFRAPSMQSHSE